MKAKRASGVAVRKGQERARRAERRAGAGLLAWIRTHDLFASVCVLLIAVALCFLNSLGNGFVFDDHPLVLDNGLLRSPWNLPRLLLAYRPLRDISYMLDYLVWGASPFGFHLTNVVIHAANAALVFLLVRRLTGKAVASLIAALIFAVHPMQTDAVTYVSGRRDILFSLFYLAAFHCYLTYRERRSYKFFFLFLAFWGLSLMSKEMAISLPALILVWNLTDAWGKVEGSWGRQFLAAAREALRRDRWLYLALTGAAVAASFYWVVIQQASVRVKLGEVHYWGDSFYANMLTALRVHAWYLKQLVYPTPVAQYLGAFDISYTLLDWRVLLSIVFVGAVLAAGAAALKKDKLVAFAIFSYFALLLPVSQIIPHHELLADHYLYLPLASFGLLVALLVERVVAREPAAKRVAYGVACAAIIMLAAMTVMRNRDWKNDFNLWLSNYKATPNSTRAAFNLAGQYLSFDAEKAEDYYRRSLELDSTFAPTYGQLSQILLSQNRVQDAEDLIARGLALSDAEIEAFMPRQPNKFRSQLTALLSLAKDKRGQPADADALLKRSIQLDPTNTQAYLLLASRQGKNRAAEIDVLKHALVVNPTALDILVRVAVLLIEETRYDEAIPYLQSRLVAIPGDFTSNYHLSQIYTIKGDCAKAREHLSLARSNSLGPKERATLEDVARRIEGRCGK